MEYVAYNVTTNSLLEYINLYFIKQSLQLEERRRLIFSIFSQILDGLDYIHAQSFYHRDLKPENILIGEGKQMEPVVKITDFDEAVSVHQK